MNSVGPPTYSIAYEDRKVSVSANAPPLIFRASSRDKTLELY